MSCANPATLEANCKWHIWRKCFICNKIAFSLWHFYFFYHLKSKIVGKQIPRILQSHRSEPTICLPPVGFHRAAKFCRSQRRPGPTRHWEGIGNDVLLMGGTSCPGSFLFAISNSRHAGRSSSSDGDAPN